MSKTTKSSTVKKSLTIAQMSDKQLRSTRVKIETQLSKVNARISKLDAKLATTNA